MLILLNTYPVWISQTFVFQYKQSAMSTHAAMMSTTLAGMDALDTQNTARAMEVLDDGVTYRVTVCDDTGLVVYDNSASDSALGRYALIPEIMHALSGNDIFRSNYRDAAFESGFASPIMTGGEIVGALYLSQYDTAQAAILTGLQSNMSLVSLIIFALVIFLSLLLSMALTRRVTGLLRAIRAASSGDYGFRASVKGRDELSQVAVQLNHMSDVLQKTESLRQQFVSNASHELKTPLASVRLLTDSILNTPDMPVETIREFVADIGQETDRLSRMTEKLMHLSRLESESVTAVRPVAVEPVIRRVVKMLEPLAAEAGVELRCELGEGCGIMGGRDDLYQIVFNLVDNAIKYNRRGGVVRVLCFARDVEVFIIIDDTGVGIPESALPFIFDRFYRVDKGRSRSAGGAGLGLSIVAQTVQRMGGQIKVDSIPERGTRFTVSFPREEGGA